MQQHYLQQKLFNRVNQTSVNELQWLTKYKIKKIKHRIKKAVSIFQNSLNNHCRSLPSNYSRQSDYFFTLHTIVYHCQTTIYYLIFHKDQEPFVILSIFYSRAVLFYSQMCYIKLNVNNGFDERTSNFDQTHSAKDST